MLSVSAYKSQVLLYRLDVNLLGKSSASKVIIDLIPMVIKFLNNLTARSIFYNIMTKKKTLFLFCVKFRLSLKKYKFSQ